MWPGEGSPAYFRRYFYGDVECLPYYTQVGVLDGKIVSAVHICKRTVACGEFQLTMGGIANVATLPEYRGRGYNTRCLQSAIAVMEADAMDFSLLFTGIDDYYRRQGYETLSVEELYGSIRPGIVSARNSAVYCTGRGGGRSARDSRRVTTIITGCGLSPCSATRRTGATG